MTYRLYIIFTHKLYQQLVFKKKIKKYVSLGQEGILTRVASFALDGNCLLFALDAQYTIWDF